MTLNIQITEEEQRQLESAAEAFQTTPDALVREFLSRFIADASRQADLDSAIDRVLQKNKELYKRLA